MLKVANSVISASRITGVLPVVNGGTGVTTSTGTGNTVLSATPTLSGDVNLSTGNLVIGTSGKGIDFSITSHPAGMTSELFSDYEEGTWTPVDQSGAGLALTVVAANYTKVGRAVIATVRVTYPVNADATQARISPPFAIAGATSFALVSSSASAIYGYAASTSMYFYLAAFGAVTNANLSGVEINISFSFNTP